MCVVTLARSLLTDPTVLQIWAEAQTYCVKNGGDPEYDGGCARAVSYSEAYAAACAEAIAVSFVDYTYGKNSDCHCDVSVQTIQKAIAHEIEIIYAFYETEVEARGCTKEHDYAPDYSHIRQTCFANSAADLLVKVRHQLACVTLASFSDVPYICN